MSDFLANLVARSLGPASDLLRPQLPSLFEAPTGSAPILEGEESVDADSVLPDAMNRPHPGERRADEHSRDPVPRLERRRETPERDHPARQTILPYEPEKQMLEPVRQETRVVAQPTVSIVEDFGERNQAEGPRVEAVARPIRKTGETKPSQNVGPRFVPVIPKMEPPHLAPRVEDGIEAEIFPSEDHSPTVRISIGRIDVRAVTQPLPPARTVVPNRPKLTLDEYLHRRNEGKR